MIFLQYKTVQFCEILMIDKDALLYDCGCIRDILLETITWKRSYT